MVPFGQHFQYIMLELFFYMFGAFFFVSHFPECKYPGVFDLFGSHAIFHIFIAAGAASHYLGLVEVYRSRANQVCPAF